MISYLGRRIIKSLIYVIVTLFAAEMKLLDLVTLIFSVAYYVSNVIIICRLQDQFGQVEMFPLIMDEVTRELLSKVQFIKGWSVFFGSHHTTASLHRVRSSTLHRCAHK